MKVYELLADESRWCKGSVARTAEGKPTNSSHPDACQWCLMGAVAHCYPAVADYSAVAEKIMLHTREIFPTLWNDSVVRKHEEVVALAKELDI